MGWWTHWGGVLFGVLKPWLAYQVRSVVAATPLANSTPSDHDSLNAPATARSVYVIVHPAARPTRDGLQAGVTALLPLRQRQCQAPYSGCMKINLLAFDN